MRHRTLHYWPLVGFTALVIICSGCAAPLHKALNPAEIASIQQTHVRATVVQEEVTIDVVKSTSGDIVAAPGGLCCLLMGSMIDKSVDTQRSKQAEAWVAPLLEQISDVDFRKDYWDALLPMLRSLKWMKLGETELAATGKEIPEEWLNDNVLLIWAQYALNPEGRFLIVTSRVQFWTHPKSKPSYYAFHSYVSKGMAPEDTTSDTSSSQKTEKNKPWLGAGEAAARWAANGAELYRAALNEGIQEMIRMIHFDLPDADQTTQHMSGTKAKVKIPKLLGGGGLESLSGEILDRGTDRIIFRVQNGNLFSLPIADIEISG